MGSPTLPAMDLRSILPDVAWIRSYRRAYLRKDIVAGIVLTAILVPAGMGYAEASGLPPIIGLYASIVPLLAYAVLGPSRILVLGPDSSLVPIIAAAIVPLSAGDEGRAVTLAALLAVISGSIIIGAGVARLGFLTALLSAPVRAGYLNGIALIVIVGQLPKLFGFSVDADGLVDEAGAFATGLTRRRHRPDRARYRSSRLWLSSSASGGGAPACLASSSRSSARRSCRPCWTCRHVPGCPSSGRCRSGCRP